MDANPYAAPLASTEVAPATLGPVRVGVWPRLGAALIDGVVIWIIGILISGAMVAMFPGYLADAVARSQAKLDPKMAEKMGAMLAWTQTMTRWSMGAAVAASLYGLLEGLFGRALGKLILGLRIADVNARTASLGRLMGRMALKHSGSFFLLAAVLTGKYVVAQVGQVPSWVFSAGCLFVFAAHRRALHDLAAGTAVYRNSDVSPR
jgi:uncharacterized RDD family membrane protein YckC